MCLLAVITFFLVSSCQHNLCHPPSSPRLDHDGSLFTRLVSCCTLFFLVASSGHSTKLSNQQTLLPSSQKGSRISTIMPESIRGRPLFSTTPPTMPYVPSTGYRARIHTVAPPRAFLNSAWGRLVAAEEVEPISRRPHDTSGKGRGPYQPSSHRLLCDRRQCRDPACMVLHSPPPPLSFVSLPEYDTTLRKPSYAAHGRKAGPNRLRKMPSFEDGRALARSLDERSKRYTKQTPLSG